MKIITKMCHTHLMSMLLQPKKLEEAVYSYKATAPDVSNEGYNGYIQTDVEFEIKSLVKFTDLFEESYQYPSERSKWYSIVRDATLNLLKDERENESRVN